MKILNNVACVLAFFPAFVHTKNLRTLKQIGLNFGCAHQQHNGHSNLPPNAIVGTTSTASLEGAFDHTSHVLLVIAADGSEANVNHIERDSVNPDKFCGRERGHMYEYQTTCVTFDRGEDDACMIIRGSLNTMPNPTGGTIIPWFCTPDNDPSNCTYLSSSDHQCNSSSAGEGADISNYTCTQEGYTCVETPTSCHPKNTFACGLRNKTDLLCAHNLDCTGSDGLANETACGGDLTCCDECGPVY